MRWLSVAVLLAAIAGCTEQDGVNRQQAGQTQLLQCWKDTDCKGERVCESGKCVAPQTAQPMVPLIAGGNAGKTDGFVAVDPIPLCVEGDGKTPIPVWKPAVDEDGNLSSDPLQKDGQIVYIELFQDAPSVVCKESELNSFQRPVNPKDALEGGLSVNLRGNTQFTNGLCYFRGFYMNEDVMGMHQGWIETYFGAVEKQKVVMSDKYCLTERID
ncbi:MAG: hypothetical protein KF800_07990 [Lysobacter sp.]|nr:hypothetical protein [Lysobacter sp.]